MSDARSGPDAGAVAPPAADADSESSATRNAGGDHESFHALRTLLVGQEFDRLDAMHARLDDREARRRDVAEVLPHVLLDHASDPRFTHALTPPVERAITASVRQNPGPLADALFPVMGPAIRKAVAAALTGMVESLNRTLEHSLSWRSLAWRVEAMRTGKSFGEVMLLHTLVYRVEQVFLIERPSGLLLQHVTEGEEGVRDADMVSGMLTAIRDFVQDSFQVKDGEALEAMNVGGLAVWIEQGPRALIAAVIRGSAPHTLRTTLQGAIERIHLEFSDEFEQFRGDTAAFDGARPTLEGCLHTEYRANAGPNHRTLWIALGAIAVALMVWAGFSLRARSRWNGYVDTLRAEPGIVVVSAGRRDGRYAVSGLRDPLARDPASFLAGAGLTAADVDGKWETYHAAAAPLALARARDVLQAPEGVTLTLNDGALTATGAAPLDWIAEASRLARLVPGVEKFDGTAVTDAAVRNLMNEAQAIVPLFAKGQSTFAEAQEENVRQLMARVGELARAAAILRQGFRVEVIGHTDADGVPEANLPLSRARAEQVVQLLTPIAGARLEIVGIGVGSDDPAVTSTLEADKQRNRRVTLKVTSIPATATSRSVQP